MKIAFRTDASLIIGTGHLVRCLALADAFKSLGDECYFFCKELPVNLFELINQHGHQIRKLSFAPKNNNTLDINLSEHPNFLTPEFQKDASETIHLCEEVIFDWFVVDHYLIDICWEDKIRKCYKKLLVIDDLANRNHSCNVLLDQNLGRRKMDYKHLVPRKCEILVGPNFSLLRSQFSNLRSYSLKRRIKNKYRLDHIFVFMGGVDQSNLTGKVISSLNKINFIKLKITVILGKNSPFNSEIKKISKLSNHMIDIMIDIDNMAEIMAEADLSIGSLGTVSWERCCLGLPAIGLIAAPNQSFNASMLAVHNCIKLIKNIDDVDKEIELILKFFMSQDKLCYFSENSSKITDGKGALRLAKLVKVS